MSKADRAAAVKLMAVGCTARGLTLMDGIVAEKHPTLHWMATECGEVAAKIIDFKQGCRKSMKEAIKVNQIAKRVAAYKDNMPELGPDAVPDPHGDVYLASACVMILDDLYQTLGSEWKKELIEPLHDAAVEVELSIDESFKHIKSRREADEFIVDLYEAIDLENY